MAKPATSRRAARKQRRRARGSMSREEILAGARELIEADGLSDLSMPGLARHLRSGVTSLYWYFRSKEDLLVALAEQVSNELYAQLPAVGDRPWQEELEAYFIAFRDGARRMPVYLELFSRHPRLLVSRPSVAQAIMRRLEDEISVLVDAGLPPEQAAHIYAVCSVYTRGFVLLEHGLVGERLESDVDERIDHFVASLDLKTFPTLTQLRSFERAMFLDDAQFRLGLRLLIGGIQREFAELGAKRRPVSGRADRASEIAGADPAGDTAGHRPSTDARDGRRDRRRGAAGTRSR